MSIWKDLRNFFYKKSSSLNQISENDYKKLFVDYKSPSQIELSYKQAWQARNQEVENYWKKATYFWAFQVASFAGYFSILASKDSYQRNPQNLYFVICIGFITSLAWVLTNKGSRFYQKQWDKHVDLLEDYVTGPLNKIVLSDNAFSGTGQNEIVGYFIMSIWFTLGIKYFSENVSFYFSWRVRDISFEIAIATILVFCFAFAMLFGYGRRRFVAQRNTLYRR